MGSNIDSKTLKSWLQRNYWFQDRSNKHEIWSFKIVDDDTGKTLIFETLTINMHRDKGVGISEKTLKDIANKMNLKKDDLINLIRRNKDIDIERYK